MAELDVALQGKSLADYTKTKLLLATGATTYTGVGDMWSKYLSGLGYTGGFSDMLQQFYVAKTVPLWARNPYNAATYIDVDGSLAIPVGFGWTPPIKIYENAGVYTTDYDPTPFLVEGAPDVTTYYVDAQNGNDANAGTAISPKKTLTTITGGRITNLLIFARGTFYKNNGGYIQSGQDNFCMVAWGGAPCIITTEADADFPFVWTDEGGGVWSSPAPPGSTLNGINVYLGTDVETLTKYTYATGLTNCQATPSTFFRTTSPIKHWVHTSDGTSPDTGHTIYGTNSAAFSTNVASFAYDQRRAFHGISFRGGNAAFDVSGDSSYSKVIERVNCDFKHASNFAASKASGTSTVISYGCTAGPSVFDGFSYSTATGGVGGNVANGIEINCTGRNNGVLSAANQGSTTHFTGKLIRVNGTYADNANDQIADVGGDTRSWNLGCTLGPKGIGAGSGAQAGNDATDTRMWFDGCVFTGLDYGWGAASGGTIYYKNMAPQPINPSNTGTITTY